MGSFWGCGFLPEAGTSYYFKKSSRLFIKQPLLLLFLKISHPNNNYAQFSDSALQGKAVVSESLAVQILYTDMHSAGRGTEQVTRPGDQLQVSC